MTAAGVTVVVCAYTLDRWAELESALEAAHADPVPHDTILVIDHNDELLGRATARWPQLRVLPNRGRRGLSDARNTALREVRTELVAFLDDDATPSAGWLGALVSPFADPGVVATGGVAHPVWPATGRPAHLPEELWWVVGCSFRGQPDSPERVRNVMGCNMAFRTAPLRAIGGFNTDLGRVGTYPVGGEETEACLLLGRSDPSARISFVAAAQVNHHVTAGRTRFGYLLQRSYCEGLSKASLSRYAGAGAALATEAGYVRTVLPAAVLRELRHPRRGLPATAGIVVSVLAAGVGYARARVMPATPVTARGPLASLVEEPA